MLLCYLGCVSGAKKEFSVSSISFQNEQPSELDVFPGGSHDKVATAMCDYIADDKNSRVIGLDGEFGSGKSSILTMLRHKLVKVDPKYKVWFFDCEQNYQGSIKSNFIELFTDELIRSVSGDESLKESLRDSRDKALGRHFTYTKNTVSRVSSWAMFLVVALFFSTSSFKELFALSKMSEPVSYWFYFVHIVSFVSPLLVLLGAQLKFKGTMVGEQPWSIFHLFKGGSDDTVTEKIQVAKDVTPLDLKRTLDADLRLLKDTHYVVILDNLDRLPKDSLRAVWSDLEIFTWASEGNNLSVIVPFCSNKVAKYLSADNERTYDARDFIAKKFPVVFRAPPIIAAGWKDGFYKLWESTYPEGQKESAEKCALLLQRHSPMAGKLVTPRLQKRYINDIATTSLTLGSEIDLVCIGAHLLLCKYGDLPLEEVIRVGGLSDAYKEKHPGFDSKDLAATKQLLHGHIGSDLESGWQIQFLQIQFLTSSKIAMAELIDDPLAMSIKEVDSERFASLVTAFGFKDAFRRYLSAEVYNSALVRTLGGAVENLSEEEFKFVISVLNREDKPFIGAVQEDETDFYGALKACRLAGLNTDGISKLKHETAKLISKSANEPIDADVLEGKQDQLVNYDLLLDALDSDSEKISVNDAAYFIHVFACCEGLSVVGVGDFSFTKAGNKSVHRHIVSLPESDEVFPISERQREFLLEVLNSSKKIGADPVVPMTEDEVLSLSESLSSYPNHEAILFGLALSGISNETMVSRVLAQPSEGRTVNQNAAVAALLLGAKKFSALAKVENIDNVVESSVFKLLFRSAPNSDVLLRGLDDPDAGWVVAKILAWAIEDEAIWRLDNTSISNGFTKVAVAVEPYGVSSRSLFEWLNDWQRHFKVDYALINKFDTEFVKELVSSSNEYFPVLKDGVRTYYGVDGCDEEGWEGIIVGESLNHGVLIDFLRKQDGYQFGSAARPAVVSVVRKIVTGVLGVEIRSHATRNIQILLAVYGQEQKNLLGTEFRNLVYAEASLPEPVIWLLENFGHLIVDAQPSSTFEVGKLMGILEYLGQHPKGATMALSYLDSRARQLANYKYSEELRGAMAVSVANLKEVAPKLYQAFARKSGFKGLFSEIFGIEKKGEQQEAERPQAPSELGEPHEDESLAENPKANS